MTRRYIPGPHAASVSGQNHDIALEAAALISRSSLRRTGKEPLPVLSTTGCCGKPVDEGVLEGVSVRVPERDRDWLDVAVGVRPVVTVGVGV